jgi:hypothetical protein
MAANRKNRPRDPLQLAKLIGDIATGQRSDVAETPEDQGKNPAAVALGRLGGLKGGQARAQKLSAKRRVEIARKAAKARYSKK